MKYSKTLLVPLEYIINYYVICKYIIIISISRYYIDIVIIKCSFNSQYSIFELKDMNTF